MQTLERAEAVQVTFDHVTLDLPNEEGQALQNLPDKEAFFIQAVLNELKRRKKLVYLDPQTDSYTLEVDDMHPELLAKIERGRADGRAGRVKSHEEMKPVFADLKQRLREKLKAENGN